MHLSTPFARGSEPPCRRSRSTRRQPRAPWTGRGSSRWGDTHPTDRRSQTPARTREPGGSATFAAGKTTGYPMPGSKRFITNTRSSSSSNNNNKVRGGPMTSPRCPSREETATPGRTRCSGPRNTAVGGRRRGWTKSAARLDTWTDTWTRPRTRGRRSSTRRCPAGSGRASSAGSRTRSFKGPSRSQKDRRRRRRRLRRTRVESPRRCRATRVRSFKTLNFSTSCPG
mmetsp:Transcript_3286/g.14673  ORF Transcript_3286/g.14673 Transcript_3286/m.14673 type:complete len:227 (+) Transcript_3286:579-1259(+)